MTQKSRWLPVAVLMLSFTASAWAQSAGTNAQSQSQSSGQAEAKGAQVGSSVDAQAQAGAEASVEAKKTLETIKDKGAKVSARTRAKTDAKLQASAAKVDDAARSMGDGKIAARLAAEYGMTTEQLMAEKGSTGASWGALMIAHTLDANATMEVTAQQLVQLHQEGAGWGQIAAGLGLRLGDCENAVRTESRVALGLVGPDGKVAVVRGEGARVGVNGTVIAGVNTAGLDLGAQTGVGASVKIKP